MTISAEIDMEGNRCEEVDRKTDIANREVIVTIGVQEDLWTEEVVVVVVTTEMTKEAIIKTGSIIVGMAGIEIIIMGDTAVIETIMGIETTEEEISTVLIENSL